MIVVIGSPLVRPGTGDHPSAAAGLAAGIAAAATAAGGTVQLVGRVGDDPAGEAILLALARDGIGHVAMLRDPARPTPAIVPPPEPGPDSTPDDAPFPAEPEGSTILEPGVPASLDQGDLELALRYLGSFSVVVVAEPLDATASVVVADAVAYNQASLIVLLPVGADGPALPADAIELEAPAHDPDGIFARTVGEFATELDRGADPADALASVASAQGWQRAAD